MPSQAEEVLTQADRPAFDSLGDDPTGHIEATAEYPIMYHALGSEPRTEHSFNVYHDICSEPTAVKRTPEVAADAVERTADELVRRDIRRIVGIGMGTSQFVPLAAGPAFWEWGGITSEDRDSVELLTMDKPYDIGHTALFAYSGSTVDTIAATRMMDEGERRLLRGRHLSGGKPPDRNLR